MAGRAWYLFAVVSALSGSAYPAHAPGTRAVLAVCVLGVVHGALNYVLFVKLVRVTGAGIATLASYLAPAVSVVLGVALLHERPGLGLAVGLPLILFGSVLATRGRTAQSSAPAAGGLRPVSQR